jgi:hypothetical protein
VSLSLLLSESNCLNGITYKTKKKHLFDLWYLNSANEQKLLVCGVINVCEKQTFTLGGKKKLFHCNFFMVL